MIFNPGAKVGDVAELSEEVTFAVGYFGGDHDSDVDDFVSLDAVGSHAALAQAHFTTVLRAGGEFHLDRFFEGGDVDFGAEDRFPGGHGEVDVYVVSFEAENGVGLNFNSDVEVAGLRCEPAARFALAGEAQAGAVLRAGGNLEFNRFGLWSHAASVACAAWATGDGPRALAGGARGFDVEANLFHRPLVGVFKINGECCFDIGAFAGRLPPHGEAAGSRRRMRPHGRVGGGRRRTAFRRTR